ncbi:MULTISPECIES: cysteine desulfurase family protein [Cyanophyceae]|uniref:cysteine desulfurase family protein n=1 Tax=Cyanophyceae TaxID=3028117 RepID=UPI00232F5995|nr:MULTISPECIES: aminotransferase class V-fold PLP-dependent enzyme [Cyanophyceae]MDB9354717.1 aminotransferase class V-fold PLP-dependent enzyme [Nodularia spumigena CS-587/03]MDB9303389.1 aminotransferase class V-fold PLP-dependent enzyme [Nodularia spumigena CS-591/12]MDB9338331.1 aminotransferase class V-fold PLP-dependent enzyme [Nodularia spumigena CS-589/07]MDB9342269.1 aminotransferase class V-fold PLP-dependent enzyme [Nodularia spumigena CS-588/06]MDB9370994.1 aminotransferase class 
MSIRPIYLDGHATTPVDERVLAAMIPYFTEHFGNPSSIGHVYGWEAEAAVKQAREILAAAINATPEEIVFTSGATEGNNLAIKGVAEAYFSQGQHIITVATEHSAVLDPCTYLKSLGFDITVLPVQPDGIIDLNELKKAFRPETILFSVMAANNEIGVLQPLAEIGEMCREKNIIFHTDAAQAIGKIPLDVQTMKVDLMSLTAHKVYGPKGIGALYVRRRNPRVQIAPQQHGGGHERGMRSGTLYTPQIVGFGKAVEIALATQETENQRLIELRQRLWEQLSQLSGVHLNGHPTQRLAGNLNISVEGVDGAALLLGLQPVMAVSSGSACSSTSTAPSHVLTALGHSEKLAYAAVRFGIGRFNTAEEIDTVAQQVISTVQSLQSIRQKVDERTV